MRRFYKQTLCIPQNLLLTNQDLHHGLLEVDQVRQMKQLRDENTRLKQLVAELTLDKTMLQDVLRKKL
jgi:putative transposase